MRFLLPSCWLQEDSSSCAFAGSWDQCSASGSPCSYRRTVSAWAKMESRALDIKENESGLRGFLTSTNKAFVIFLRSCTLSFVAALRIFDDSWNATEKIIKDDKMLVLSGAFMTEKASRIAQAWPKNSLTTKPHVFCLNFIQVQCTISISDMLFLPLCFHPFPSILSMHIKIYHWSLSNLPSRTPVSQSDTRPSQQANRCWCKLGIVRVQKKKKKRKSNWKDWPRWNEFGFGAWLDQRR